MLGGSCIGGGDGYRAIGGDSPRIFGGNALWLETPRSQGFSEEEHL